MKNKSKICDGIVKAMAKNKKLTMIGSGKRKLRIKQFYPFSFPVALLSDGMIYSVTEEKLKDLSDQVERDKK